MYVCSFVEARREIVQLSLRRVGVARERERCGLGMSKQKRRTRKKNIFREVENKPWVEC